MRYKLILFTCLAVGSVQASDHRSEKAQQELQHASKATTNEETKGLLVGYGAREQAEGKQVRRKTEIDLPSIKIISMRREVNV